MTDDLAALLAKLELDTTRNQVHAALFPIKKKVNSNTQVATVTTNRVSESEPLSDVQSLESELDECPDSSFEIISSELDLEDECVDPNNNTEPKKSARPKSSGAGQYKAGSLPWPEQYSCRFLLDSNGQQRVQPRLSRPIMPTANRDLDSKPGYEGIYQAIISNLPLTYGFKFGLRQAELMDRNELLDYRDNLDYEYFSELDESHEYSKI